MDNTYSLAPGSPPRTPAAAHQRSKSILPLPLSFDKSRPFHVGDGPMSAPISFLHSQGHHQLDADTVAIAQAAAAAAYNEAIANMTAARNGTSTGNYYQQQENNNTLSSSPRQHNRPLSGGFYGPPLTPTSPPRADSSSLMPLNANPNYQGIPSPPAQTSPVSSYFLTRSESNSKNGAAANLTNQWESMSSSPSGDNIMMMDNHQQHYGGGGSSTSSDIDPKEKRGSPNAPSLSFPESSKKMSLYKTELCRSWEESGACRYGTKCQFAHSTQEVRNLDRHPKYKTEMCKTFWERGTCPYGKRCCFIHTLKGSENAVMPSSTVARGNGQVTPPRHRANSGNNSPQQQQQRDTSPCKTPPRSALKPLGITTSSPPTGENKLFDQITNEFSLWSPSMNSPDISGGNAFSFSSSSIQQSNGHGNTLSMSGLENSMSSFHISSPLNNASSNSPAPLSANPSSLLLNTALHHFSGANRSTISAGVPSPQPFFAPDPFDDDEIPLSAPATRFHNIGNSTSLGSPGGAGGRTLTTRISASVKVPILSTAPPSRISAQQNKDFYSPLSTSFTSILDDDEDDLQNRESGRLLSPAVHGPGGRSFAQIMNGSTPVGATIGKMEPTIIESTRQPIGRAGTLRKFDSGVHFREAPLSPRGV